MERSVLHWVCVFALLALPVLGCSDENGGTGGSDLCEGIDCDDGNECTEDTCADGMCDSIPVDDGTSCGDGAGTCQVGSCVGTFACTEQGIRDAIAVGGGPHTFDCDGPTTVVTEAEIVIDNDVILDGEGDLTVDGNDDHRVFSVSPPDATVELWGFEVTGGSAVTGSASDRWGGGIMVSGALALKNSTVSGNTAQHNGGGIAINNGSRPVVLTNSTISGNTASEGCCGGIYLFSGTLTLTNSTVSGNGAENEGGGILAAVGTNLTLTNSTVTGNSASSGGGIFTRGYYGSGSASVTLTNSTVSGNTADSGGGIVCVEASCTIVGSLVDGDCSVDPGLFSDGVTSNGYNIESPGDTCGFDQPTDQVSVGTDDLKLGPLQDNGGPTMTQALGEGSVAIDVIPEGDCVVDADQRHVSRPRDDGCDVGAVEVDLVCVGAEVGSECTHPDFTGVCGADTMCWATDCSELRDGINCLVPRNRVVFPGLCAAGSCEEEAVFP